MLLVIAGPVGVGKSTVVKLLSKVFNDKGMPAAKTFLKAFHGPSFVIWCLATKLIIGRQKTPKPQMLAPWYLLSRFNSVLAWRLTVFTALLDAFLSIPLKLFQIQLLRQIGYIVICEEYLYGTLTDYMYTFINASDRKGKWSLRFTIAVSVAMLRKYRPSMIILLDADRAEIIKRWRKRGYGDPQKRYVMFQRIFLNMIKNRKLFADLEIYHIYTSGKDPLTVVKEILPLMNSHVRRISTA